MFTVTPIESIADGIEFTMYVAEYDGDGCLTGLKLGTAAKDEDGKITITSDIPKTGKYKFMLWDSDYCPLMNAIDNLE